MEKNAEFIRKKEFHIVFKGYKPEEVDKFLDILSVEFDRLIKKNREIQESLDKLKFESTVEDNDIKKVIQDALISAHKVAEDIKIQAKKEADSLIDQRKLEEEKAMGDLQMKKLKIEESIIMLESKYEELKNRLRKFTEDISQFLVETEEDIITAKEESFEMQSGDQHDITSEEEPKHRRQIIFDREPVDASPVPENPTIIEEKNTGKTEKEFSNFDRYNIDSEKDSGNYFEIIQKQQERDIAKKSELQKQQNPDEIVEHDQVQVSENIEEQDEKGTATVEEETLKRERKKIDIANPDIIENFFRASDD